MGRRRNVRIGDVVQVQENLRDHTYRRSCGVYIRRAYRELIGHYFRVKGIEQFVQRGSAYYLGDFISKRRDGTESRRPIHLPKIFLKVIEKPCISLRKKGIKIEEQIEEPRGY